MWPSQPDSIGVSRSEGDMGELLLGLRRSAALWMGTGWLAADDGPDALVLDRRNWASADWPCWLCGPTLAVKRCFLS